MTKFDLVEDQSYKKYRSLTQYRDLTDEEFEEAMKNKDLDKKYKVGWERKINAKWEEFEKDYDLTDLKPNDKAALRALIQVILRIEEYELQQNKISWEGINESNIIVMEKLGKLLGDLRNDLSKLQNDLNITRKARKGDQETSVLEYIESLKAKAKKFYDQRTMKVFCPKCNTLIFQGWWLYPEYKMNAMHFVCKKQNTDGSMCGHDFDINSKSLLEMGMSNKVDIPDTLK